jgi:hypothetical protein
MVFKQVLGDAFSVPRFFCFYSSCFDNMSALGTGHFRSNSRDIKPIPEDASDEAKESHGDPVEEILIGDDEEEDDTRLVLTDKDTALAVDENGVVQQGAKLTNFAIEALISSSEISIMRGVNGFFAGLYCILAIVAIALSATGKITFKSITVIYTYTGDYNVIMSKNFGSIRVDFIFSR